MWHICVNICTYSCIIVVDDMLYYMDTNGQVVCVIISSQLKAKTYVFSKSFEGWRLCSVHQNIALGE